MKIDWFCYYSGCSFLTILSLTAKFWSFSDVWWILVSTYSTVSLANGIPSYGLNYNTSLCVPLSFKLILSSQEFSDTTSSLWIWHHRSLSQCAQNYTHSLPTPTESSAPPMFPISVNSFAVTGFTMTSYFSLFVPFFLKIIWKLRSKYFFSPLIFMPMTSSSLIWNIKIIPPLVCKHLLFPLSIPSHCSQDTVPDSEHAF